MKTPALEAFDTCPKRVTGGGHYKTVSACPKYPRGIEIDNINNVKDVFEDDVRRDLVAQRLGCVSCPVALKAQKREELRQPFEGYHPVIREECEPRFEAGHYDDAVLTGILIVRDRMRELTGYEGASDAFGKGKLVIAGSANEYTDNNFQQGSMFLMLANDRFRNELAHTADQNDLIKEPNLALQFLGISSISMFMLDTAMVVHGRNQES